MNLKYSLNDYAYDKIQEFIKHAEYLPGQKLIVRELCEELDISPTPVKEALNRLATEGMVEAVPRRGFIVPRLSRKKILDSLETRRIIEKAIVPLAIKNAGLHPETVEYLERLLLDFNRCFQSEEMNNDYLEKLEIDFHTSFAKLTGNEVLLDLYTKCLNLSSLFKLYNIFGVDHKAESAAHNHHADYISGLKTRDEQLICTAIDKAIDHNWISISTHMENADPNLFDGDKS